MNTNYYYYFYILNDFRCIHGTSDLRDIIKDRLYILSAWRNLPTKYPTDRSDLLGKFNIEFIKRIVENI